MARVGSWMTGLNLLFSPPEGLVDVDDLILVPLLGQEKLAVDGEFLVVGVARDQGVKVGAVAVGLGPEDASEPLSFSWREPNEPKV